MNTPIEAMSNPREHDAVLDENGVPLPTSNDDAAPLGLAALEARLRQDLEWLALPAKPWVLPQIVEGQRINDVIIVGAGMAGMALQASLLLLGVDAVAYDQATAGFEGPWATTARMETLRSPKELVGPAIGLPALTFRAWFEAQFGLAQWRDLEKIPRLQWMDYLRWYRHAMALTVHNGQRLVDLEPERDGVAVLHFENVANQTRQEVLARHVVLATGRDGLGGQWQPPWAADVPARRRAHSADLLDARRLRGARVAVIGAGASAMDSAATALEAGAKRVDILIRRADLPRVNKSKGAGSPGLAHGFSSLSNEWKWRWRHYINREQVPPPHNSTLRVSRHTNAHFLFDTQVSGAGVRQDGTLRLDTNHGPLATDFVLFSTGFRNDWQGRPEFARFADDVLTWGDSHVPGIGERDAELARSPDLDALLAFRSRRPKTAEALSRIHAFCYAATLSHGAIAGDIPHVSVGAKRLAEGIAGKLFTAQADRYFEGMAQYRELELFGNEWTPGTFPDYPEDKPRGTRPERS